MEKYIISLFKRYILLYYVFYYNFVFSCNFFTISLIEKSSTKFFFRNKDIYITLIFYGEIYNYTIFL